MWHKVRWFAPVLAVVAAATALAPEAGAQSASAVIAGLKAQGYNVMINWTTGYDTKPLSQCWVTSINNPGDLPPSRDTFVTVYVDVACPNHDYDYSDDGGFGIGFGF
jgi:hypothetical protein